MDGWPPLSVCPRCASAAIWMARSSVAMDVNLEFVKGHFIPQYWGQIIPHPLVA
jgi:hypothetical protein